MSDITFKAPNGELIIARDENQAAAFLNAGLEEVKATKTASAKEVKQ